MFKISRPAIQRALFIIGISFVVYILAGSRHYILEHLKTIDVPLLFFSLVFSLAYNFAVSVVYFGQLKKYGFRGEYLLVRNLCFFGQFAKYIPGKIWGIVYHVAAIRMPSAGSVVTFANLDLFLATILIALASSTGLIFMKSSPGGALAGFVLLLAVAIFFLRSCGVFTVAQELARRVRHEGTLCRCVSNLSVTKGVLQVLVMAGLYLAPNFLFMAAVFGLSPSVAANYIAYLGLGWVLGAIFFIVPAGVGVREMAFIYFAKLWLPEVPITELGAMAVLLRLWQVIQDIVGVAFVMVLIWRDQRVR